MSEPGFGRINRIFGIGEEINLVNRITERRRVRRNGT